MKAENNTAVKEIMTVEEARMCIKTALEKYPDLKLAARIKYFRVQSDRELIYIAEDLVELKG